MSIGGHACSIERLWFETLIKCVAGFAERRTYMTRSPERFQDDFSETLLLNILFSVVWSLLSGLQQLVLHARGWERFLRKYDGRHYASFQSDFRGCYWRQDHASTCSRYDGGHFETRTAHAIINFGVALTNTDTFYIIVDCSKHCFREWGIGVVR